MKKGLFTLALAVVSAFQLSAKEGMWIPLLLQQYNATDLENMGLKISVNDIYDANKSSMKDAVVLFGGGCTGEIISNQGLLLTNHHCGYGQIQSHSSVENDYLTNGFWAMSQKEELPNEGLTAMFIKEIVDVSDVILKDISPTTNETKRQQLIKARIDSIKAEVTKTEFLGADIKPFYYGNQYFLFVTQTYTDVRLVGAPPSSIGKFGFDTDNWVWPRHTGDFSMFRIYADKDNNPAGYSADNVPYQPKHHFPVSLQGVKADDFSMVFGFPARTQEYLPSTAVQYIMEEENPAKINMRDISLEVINEAMRSSAELNIQYAAKQSRISNAWKKWKGQIIGLNTTDALGKKKALEDEFNAAVAGNAAFKNYKGLLAAYEKEFSAHKDYAMARSMFIEVLYYGPEILRFADGFDALLDEELTDEDREKLVEKLKKKTERHFKDYNAEVDKELMLRMMPEYTMSVTTSLVPTVTYEMFKADDPKLTAKSTENVYKLSMFASREKVMEFLNNYTVKSDKKLEKDLAFVIVSDMMRTYNDRVKDEYRLSKNKVDSIQRIYMAGLLEVLPDAKNYYPDANFSLRLSYGKVMGSEPVDGMMYKSYTTTEGIMQKMDTTSYEFDVPQKLADLIMAKDYGPYADTEGKMHVCYTATNHTSGGNSGSPALNANGHLVGLNFDRTWESTMSDIMYDPEICRNIMVDIRYVLFIVDKYAGASHLVEEMDLIK